MRFASIALALTGLSLLLQGVQGQSSYIYKGVPTQQLMNDIDGLQMGAVINEPSTIGYEVNFWAKPYYASTTKKEPIVNFQDSIDLEFGYTSSNSTIGFGLVVGTNKDYQVMPSLSKELWINLNVRVYYDNYILANAWQGNIWYELNPSLKLFVPQTDSSLYRLQPNMTIKKTSSNLGCYVAEFRVFKLSLTDSYGQFLRHYEVPFNARWPNTISYFFIRDDMINVQPSSTATFPDVKDYGLIQMDVLRCNTSMSLQDGTCSNCLTSKCLYCQTIDKQLYNICRYCDGVSSSCQAISKCPTDYYSEMGICYKCPIGCSSCTRGDLCTSCDTGLVLNQVSQVQTITNAAGLAEDKVIILNATCDCPIGQFGTKNISTDTVTCGKCDETCHTCEDTNVKCTSCSAPLFWIDIDGGLCVTSCSDMFPNYFGDVQDRVCKPCASNCNKCTSLTGCTDCDNFNETKLVQQQKLDADLNPMVDDAGEPLMESVNKTFTNKLLNAEGVCVQTCPTNSIDNSTFFMCHMCPTECLTCSNISRNCTSCNITLGSLYSFQNTSFTPSLTEGRCLPTCPMGFYSDANVCKNCDSSCTVCDQLNYCTNCTMNYDTGDLYHFVNYQCKLDCGERYYPDHSDPTFYFCRNCPSNCLNCDSARLCTSCVTDYFITSINGYQLCVRAKDCAEGSFANTATGTCDTCISNCKTCGGVTGCSECFDGYFLDNNQCIDRCPTGKFAQANGACTDCISNCDECKSTLTCQTCTNGYVLLEDTLDCHFGTTCPNGYYLRTQNNCTLCKPECEKCTSATVCTGCILGHTLKGSNCENNCGNGFREDIEYCDDGNNDNGDGCKADCTVEDSFVCEQGVFVVGASSAPDICRCDPVLSIAEWTDFWGTIKIKFDTEIYYNDEIAPKSNIPLTFCQQILTPSTIARLGKSYACYLKIATGSSELVIDVGKDATIGNKNESYDTTITLIERAVMVTGCNLTGIPISYQIKNLPLDTPQVLFTSSLGTTQVGKCANQLTLNLATSKGLTKRNIDVTWTLISIVPADDNLKEQLQSSFDNVFKGYSFYTISRPYLELLAGKNISLQSKVTNFLTKDSKNTTLIQFLKTKKLEILDIPDSLTFQNSISNQLFPRFRLPYCSADSTASITTDQEAVSFTCLMYDIALTTKQWPLVNCTIPAWNMTLTTQYIVQISAVYSLDATLNTVKNVFIQPSSPPVQVALIQGCNRVFSPNNSFTLEAIYNTNSTTTTFVWQCTDKATGSVCFSTSYQYITLGNSASITVSKDIFFYNMQYEFMVTAFDSASNTNDSISCMMYSSGAKSLILDVYIEGEATRTGFIDFSRKSTAFKAFISKMGSVDKSKLTYTWQFYDSSGKYMSDSEVQIYQNSIGVSTDLMNRNSLYTVVVVVTDGVSWGNASQILRTKPDISNDFLVEPSDLEPRALTTMFSLSVFSQKTFDTLDKYVFGYIDPGDSITKIPMTQMNYKKYANFILPDPGLTMAITCYVDVIMPNGVSMTYYQAVALATTDLTVDTFLAQVSVAVMDDLVESMQMKHKLVSMRSRMTVAQRSQVINKILSGLVKETTPLSDYYIQSSVGSLLEYISKEKESLLSDAKIVTVASQLFKQMTIDENSGLKNGRSIKFGRAVTQNLFNFANNIFQIEFTSLIGGPVQLTMKTMFMEGLKNVLKGSLSNFILGDEGGFSYQGQNIYAKAIKFDTLETKYKMNATLPKSILGKYSQNFVNITLPGSSSASNPCKGYPACQVSVIILDTPITNFISNSKDSELKSMLVEVSISSTEVSSPDPYIAIQELAITGLSDPIRLTIPLYSELNTSNPNNTLACGFIDTQDNIFKQTGLQAEKISNSLVTCLASHLTQIAVEQYAKETSSTTESQEDAKIAAQANEQKQEDIEVVDMWSSWAIYACFAIPGLLIPGLLFARWKDAKDVKNMQLIQKKKKKIYVSLYLEPIPEVRKAYVVKQKKTQNIDEEDYERVRQIKEQMANDTQQQAPVEAPSAKGNTFLKAPNPNATANSLFVVGDLDAKSQGSRLGKKKKTKKKKVKKSEQVDPIANDLFFEGGAPLPEYTSFGSESEYFEGGDEDDFFAVAEAEESAKLSSKKKKKKKINNSRTVMEPSELPQITQNRRLGGGLKIHEMDLDDDGNSVAKRSSRSKSKGKKSKTAVRPGSKSRERNHLDDSQAQLNASNFGGFDNQSSMSKGKKKKKKKRPLSRENQETMGDEFDQPDAQAEEFVVSPKKKKSLKKKQTSKSTKTVVEVYDDKGGQSARAELRIMEEAGILPQMDTQGNAERVETQNKGFETLMNDELEKAKAELQVKKNHKEHKKKKEARKKKGYFEKETASCVQFCIWNCVENHRCCSLFKFYNQYLSRSSRVVLLIMSWFLFIVFTGELISGSQIIAPKSTLTEQFAVGTVAALISRLWIVAVTGFLMHSKREKVYQEIFDADDAKFKVGLNTCRYVFGMILVFVTILVCYLEVFSYAAYFTTTLSTQWLMCFLCAIVSDLVIVDGGFISIATMLTLTVGAAPDSCGRCRNLWLNLVPEAIKEAAE